MSPVSRKCARKTEPALQAPSCSGHLSVAQKSAANVAGVANPDPLAEDHIPRADGVSSDARLKAAPGDSGDTGDTFGVAGSDLLMARIADMECPADFSMHHWRRLHARAAKFARSEWLPKATEAGWSLDELFKIVEPFCNVAWQGAAWCVGDAEVIDVTAVAIVIRTVSGSVLQIYRSARQ